MRESFTALQQRHAAFLASVEQATLHNLLQHLILIFCELQDGGMIDPNDSRWKILEDYLDTLPAEIDPVSWVAEEIAAVETLIGKYGDARLK